MPKQDALRDSTADDTLRHRGPPSGLLLQSTELSPLPTIFLDGKSLRVRHANPAICRLLHLELADIRDWPIAELLSPIGSDHFSVLLRRVVSGCAEFETFKFDYLAHDGKTLSLTCLAWPEFGVEDELRGTILQITDIADTTRENRGLEQATEEIRAINEALLISSVREHEAAELAAKIQQQLHHAQRMEGIGKLAGGIAHDFNNLLTAILGFTELAADTLPPAEPVQKYLKNVKNSAERAAKLTSQLLAFARKQVAVPKILDINTQILEIGTMLRPLVGEDIEFDVVLRSEAVLVKMDPGQLGQVLVNLVVNARDAMPDGGKITIETGIESLASSELRMEEDADPGQFVAITVSDTGTGMTDEVKAHLFEPFFTTKEVGKGTGLGLATCYGIMQQNGGYIRVESGVNAGTTVRLCLPNVDGTAQVARQGKAAEKQTHATGTILLVEDEAVVREVAVTALRIHGHAVLEAKNGLEGLQMFLNSVGEIDLVVADLIMPQMGGIEMTRHMRLVRPEMKILYISGYSEESPIPTGVKDRLSAYLRKPFSPDDISLAVQSMLTVRSS